MRANGRWLWNCGCSTCHVHILEGFSSLDEMEDDEDDILGKAEMSNITLALAVKQL